MIHGRHRRLPNWSIPALYALVAVAAALILPRLEAAYLPTLHAGMSPQAAVAILSSVGTGMIALTGIVFSLAFVMVQFSATAYSPRLVTWLARDPVLWHAVGIFSATFLYSLGAIAWIDRAGSGKTPFFSSWLVIVLLLVSVGIFIGLIEKLSLLQIHRMLAFTADQARQVIDNAYPPLDQPQSLVDPEAYAGRPLTQTLYHAGPPRSIQALDVPALVSLASAVDGVITIVSPVGDTLVEGTVMLRLFGARRPIDERELRSAFAVGAERTFEQDPKYAIRLLVDIAIKALSPAVNDPTTAVQALDQIEDLLRHLGRRRLEIGVHRDRDGTARLFVPHPSWEDFLALGLDEICYYGATSVQVMRRMKALVADVLAAMPPERQGSLRRHQKRLDAIIVSSFRDETDRREASIEDRQGLGMPRTH
ncbi:MAG TPA: DUF2254 domain-containing protein [Candidatus Methylomirabilis sp.]|nr:DUF2254 domain-containing protein [Candidatus Methylomirabilis sp.]